MIGETLEDIGEHGTRAVERKRPVADHVLDIALMGQKPRPVGTVRSGHALCGK